MASRHEIISIDFRANAAKANPAMDSLREAAKNMNEEIEKTKKNIEEGFKAGKPQAELDALGATLISQEKKLRSFETAMASLSKGVGTLSRAIDAFNNGSLGQMSAAFQKASYNAAENAKKALLPGSKDYEKNMAELDALQQRNLENLAKYKLRTEQMLKSIAEGGKISTADLKQEADGMQELMKLLPHMGHEWMEYNGLLKQITEQTDRQSAAEKRLKGEMVDASDARREAKKLTEEGAAAARQSLEAADKEIERLHKEKEALKDNRSEIERQIAATRELVNEREKAARKQEKTVKSVESQIDAQRRRKDDEHDPLNVNRQNADTLRESAQQQAENLKLQKEKVKDLGAEVQHLQEKLEKVNAAEPIKPKVDTSDLAEAEKLYNQKVEERIRLEKELEAIKNRSWKDDPEIKRLDEEIAKLDELIAVSDKYKKQFAKMSDEKFESGYMGKDEGKRSLWEAQKYLKSAYDDKLLKAPLAEHDDLPDSPEYKAAAKRVADGIMQNAQENVRRVIFDQIKNGTWTAESMQEQLEGMRNMMYRAGNSELGLKDNPEYNAYKFIIAQMEKYIEVAKKVQEERKQIAGSDPFLETAQRESDYDKNIWPESLSRQKEKREDQDLTGYTRWREENKDKELRKEEEVRKAKDAEAEAQRKLNEEKKKSTTATNDQTEAIKKQEEELGKLEQKLKRLEESRDDSQNDVKKSLKAVKDMGLTEEDLADDAKVREAIEKKVLEIMEAQAKVGQEIAEQRKKLADEVKMSDLGGTKADQEFYAKNKDRWDVSDYAEPDDMIERIAHLERLKRLKNGKRFNPDEDWDDDDDLDEDAPIMNDKERQAINDELRFLKQHIREELLKTIKEVGDFDKAVEQYTGGDGVSEDAKFGEQLNDKIGEIKDKIEERIETTLDRYGEMLNEDRDIDSKMTKEQLTKRVSQHMEAVKENHGVNRSWLEETQDDINTTKGEIEAKKQLIEQMKQQAAATKETTEAQQQSNETDAETLQLKEQLQKKQEELSQEQANQTRMEKEWQETKEKARIADEEATKAEKELGDAIEQNESRLQYEKQQLEEKNHMLDDGNATLREQQQQLADNDKAQDENARKTAEAEQQKAQAQDLTIKRMEDMLALLKKEYEQEATNEEQRNSIKTQMEQIEAALRKAKGGFESADEVLQRFNDHMNASKTASEGMASSIDEKLGQATSSYDSQIEDAIKDVEHYEQEIKEVTQDLADMEAELAELKKKHANSSWFRKQTKGYQREGRRINELHYAIEGGEDEDGFDWHGAKEDIEYWKEQKQSAQKWLNYYKQKKAEELGITEGVEEKKQHTQNLTLEQMQEGIKLLEEEYRKTDHTTADGIKRREQLRQAIDQMNQEIKESTGEWMSYAEAERFALQAAQSAEGKGNFIATQQQMQQALAAVQREYDKTVKSIQQKEQAQNKDQKAIDAEKAKLETLEKQLKDLKFEQDNFNMSHEQMEKLLKHPKKADDLDQLKAAIKRADGELHRMKQSLGDNNDQYRKFSAQVKAAKNVLKEMEGQAKATTGQLEKAWSRLKTYVGLYMGFNAAWQKLTGTIGDMKILSDRMGEVGKTTQMASGEIARMTANLAKMDTRTALTSLVELSAKAGQLGLKSREDVEGFTEAANKMLVALPEMGADGATQMMKVALATGEVAKIQKEMDDGLIDGSSATAVAMEKIASTIDQLRANSAAAAPQITDFVKRVGAVGAQSGITIDQVAALGSTVDALGMRVEMSATALSRMIPAIKANAFEVAKAIGMAPEALRDMFDEAGGGMNAMLAIFQHIKDSGMDADSIESMLGMGGMRDVMKDLNQQGARAGIVFAGLSQNVDVLRQHLGLAKTAYEENIAIQQEYDRMNETTAAKWERLGNQIEEMFVGPGSQSVLGDIADGLRSLVNLIAGPLNTAFWATSAAVLSIKTGLTSLPAAGGKVLDYLRESAAKAGEALQQAAERGAEMSSATKGIEQAADVVDDVGDALEGAQEAGEQAGEAMETATGAIAGMGGAAKVSIFSINGLKMAWKGLDATMKANIIVAVIALLYTLGKAIYNIVTEVYKHNKAVADANAIIQIAIDRFEGYWQKMKDTKTALDQARKSTDGLKEGSDELAKATVNVTKADNDHKAAIADINGMYGKYLGFLLTETNYANLAAAAHDKITAAIRREILAKQQQAAIDQVTQDNTDNLKEGLTNLTEELSEDGRLNSQQVAQAKRDVQKFMRENIRFNVNSQRFDINENVSKYLQGKGISPSELEGMDVENLAAAWFYEYLKDSFHLNNDAIEDITGVYRYGGGYRTTNYGGRHFRGDYASAYLDYIREVSETQSVFTGELDDAEAEDKKSTQELVLKLQKQAKEAQSKIVNKSTSGKERNKAYEDLANALEGLDANIDQLNPKGDKALVDSTKKLADDISKSVNRDKLIRARTNARSIFGRATGDTVGETPLQPLDQEKNPWGEKLSGESTDWKNMTAEQLVNRRKQMNDFVNAIQTDTDIQSVLKEDAALKKAIENGMSSDMRTVIEWYNTERLKIQDELHARHLTNTGDWLDPKKQRLRKKQLQDEWGMYLKEIDAYYTERKTRIQEAGTEEGITEAEVRNRTLANEMEWHQRRAELQQLYADKSVEVTEQEQDAIFAIISERTGEDVSLVERTIGKTVEFMKKIGEASPVELKKALATLGLGWERDFLKQQQAVTQQMKAIQDIIDRERPFNGITKNLRENLVTMGILTADMTDERNRLMKEGADLSEFNARQAAAEFSRTAFMLGEAEHAYSTTIEDVMRRMASNGLSAWSDELRTNPQMQEGLMAQLRSTFDQIQDAINKEASQLKKQAEIMWNNILLPDGRTTLKQQADRLMADLGLDEERIKRANSLIEAGQASERVADRLAIQQMKIQLAMQEHYYNLMRKQGKAHFETLLQQAEAARARGDEEEATLKTLDAQHAQMSLNLATAKEETELAKQREDIIARTEESQNRLYQELRSWAELLASSMQSVFDASHAGDKEYYNERAKLDLTGKGGPGAGTYIVIEHEGSSDASAHYEHLDERQALERQREIENQNAVADALKKVMDDLNMKMSETITDQLNAMLQNQSIDANTDATLQNTSAILGLSSVLQGDGGSVFPAISGGNGQNDGALSPSAAQDFALGLGDNPMDVWMDQQDSYTERTLQNQDKLRESQSKTSKEMSSSTQSAFAKMTAAANLYGIAYQTMSNDNLSSTQKFLMFAVQAAGQSAIAMLTTNLATTQGEAATALPGILGKAASQLGPIAGPIAFAAMSALLGGLMGLAVSKIAKSKSQISQVTGASVGAGRLATGMLTYGEGNVNEFTDPSTLTVGRKYNVDGADGKTYRARYMGNGAKTHITNGPEFHLVGEKGREAIIDARTTRNIQLNDPEIWRSIKVLYNGGRINRAGRDRGVAAFADGNLDTFDAGGYGIAANGTGGVDIAAMTEAMNRQAAVQEALLERLNQPIVAQNVWTGPDGIPNMYNKMEKEARRHGVKYL